MSGQEAANKVEPLDICGRNFDILFEDKKQQNGSIKEIERHVRDIKEAQLKSQLDEAAHRLTFQQSIGQEFGQIRDKFGSLYKWIAGLAIVLGFNLLIVILTAVFAFLRMR